MANTFKYYPETMGNSSGYPISLPFPKGSATSAVNVARQLPKYLGHVPSQSVHTQLPSMASLGYFNQPSSTYYAPPAPLQQHQQPPILPPPGLMYTSNNNSNVIPPPVQMIRDGQQQPQQSNQVNGGVSENLDYDISIMSKFIMENAFVAFNANYSTDDQTTDLFFKGISSVLNATRLPSATIFLAIDYLFKYINKLSNGIHSIGGNSINIIYQNTMIAFILANKFNDDKTFTNSSWSQATGILINVINDFERQWLRIFNWELYDSAFLYFEFVKNFEIFKQNQLKPAVAVPTLLSPIVNVGDTRNVNFNLKPTSANNLLSPVSNYETPMLMPHNMFSSPSYQSNSRSEFSSMNGYYNYYNYNQPRLNYYQQFPNIYSSPISETQFDYDFYNFSSQQQQQQQKQHSLLPAAPQLPPPHVHNQSYGHHLGWKSMDDTINHSRFERSYFPYSAVY
ncbi:Clg1p [Saccharomyces cerevisiae YJM1338]|nr:Clg1p [Saccharomyces cerevisiae YJM1338]